MQNALLAGVLVAVAAAIVGTFVVLRGMSLLGDSLAHASFGGVALGLFLGVSPLYLALATAILGGVAIHILEHRRVMRADAALGVVFAAGLGLGVIVVSVAGGFNVNLLAFLFGSVLTVTREDLHAFALLVAVLLAVIVGFYKEYLYIAFDEETAAASGLPVHALNIVFAVLTAMAVVVAIKIVGVLLVSALLVIPAVASQQVARSFRQALALAVVVGVLSMVGGIAFAAQFDWPPGGAVVTVSLVALAAVTVGVRAVRWIRAGPVR